MLPANIKIGQSSFFLNYTKGNLKNTKINKDNDAINLKETKAMVLDITKNIKTQLLNSVSYGYGDDDLSGMKYKGFLKDLDKHTETIQKKLNTDSLSQKDITDICTKLYNKTNFLKIEDILDYIKGSIILSKHSSSDDRSSWFFANTSSISKLCNHNDMSFKTNKNNNLLDKIFKDDDNLRGILPTDDDIRKICIANSPLVVRHQFNDNAINVNDMPVDNNNNQINEFKLSEKRKIKAKLNIEFNFKDYEDNEKTYSNNINTIMSNKMSKDNNKNNNDDNYSFTFKTKDNKDINVSYQCPILNDHITMNNKNGALNNSSKFVFVIKEWGINKIQLDAYDIQSLFNWATLGNGEDVQKNPKNNDPLLSSNILSPRELENFIKNHEIKNMNELSKLA